jgi:PAS domain S-box-containing protein
MTNIERLAELTRDISVEISKLKCVDSAICQTADSVIITDANLLSPGPTITYVNTAFEKLTGYTESELIGLSPRILHGPLTDRNVLASMKTSLLAGLDFRGILTNYRKNGKTYTFECTITPVLDDAGLVGGFVSIQRLISENHL